jgi:hypothetical protein
MGPFRVGWRKLMVYKFHLGVLRRNPRFFRQQKLCHAE